MLSEGTIIALSTPSGNGAIAIIRISGRDAFKTTSLFFRSKSKISWDNIEQNFSILGDFIVEENLIDEVLITKYKSPRSYTGEDLVEISCHGSLYIQQKIISSFINVGIIPAKAGEFTLRSYLNKKIDLSQAEAVADIIVAETESAHKLAIQQMRGGFSSKMEILRQELIKFKSLIELELDFSEEDVEFANLNELRSLLKKLHEEIYILKESYSYGNVIKNGVPVAIAGEPNVGKSSLLNALFEDEKAIVSNIPGTTRDIIEDTLVINGILFRFIDTAGLRKTKDFIESIGVKKAREKVNKASILIYLYEESSNYDVTIKEIKKIINKNLKILVLENKIDLNNNNYNKNIGLEIKNNLDPSLKILQFGISTKNSKNLKILKEKLITLVKEMKSETNLIIHNSRHFYALSNSLDSIKRIQNGLENNISGDLLSVDLKDAIMYIGSITGKIDIDQDILSKIFGDFCIGK